MLIWGLRLVCLKPVEETYGKGSAFKMFKVRNSSRAVVVTPFKHSRSSGNSKVHPTTEPNMLCILFDHVFSCRYEKLM